MRPLLNFKDAQAPFCALVCFDKATHTPQFALYHFGLSVEDIDVIGVNGVDVPLIGRLDKLAFTSTRPQGGGGLLRRTIGAEIKSDAPFNYGIWTKAYYNGGQSDLECYFGLYAVDYTKYTDDITLGCFFGYFGFNAGTAWDEKSGTTKIELIDIILTLEDRPNYMSDEISQNLENTEWASLMNLPVVIGNFSKYPLVGRTLFGGSGYAQSSTIVKNFAQGQVTQDYTGSGYLYLGTSPYLAAHVGSTVKIKISGSEELIQGTIVSDSGEYALSISARDTNFGTTYIRAVDAGVVLGAALGLTINLDQIYLTTDDLDKIPDDRCWLQFNADFYAVTGNPHTEVVNVQLNGIADVANKKFGINPIASVTYPLGHSGPGITFQDTTVTGIFSGAQAYLNYGKVANDALATIYFRNKGLALVDAVNIGQGTGWMILATEYENNGGTSDEQQQDYYVRALDSTEIVANHLFFRTGPGFVVIPPGEIVSITTGCTDFGYTDLTRVRLKRLPSQALSTYKDVNGQAVAVANDYIYVDLESVKRVADIIRFLLTGTYLDTNDLIGESLTCSVENSVSPVMGVKIADERLVDVLDKLCYESGFVLTWIGGVLEIESSVKRNCAAAVWKDDDGQYCKIVVPPDATIGEDIVVENSVSLTVGKLLTLMDGEREYVPLYFNFTYTAAGTVDSASQATRRLQSSFGVKQYDRIFNYTFNYIHDKESAAYAALQFALIGHAANVPETTRIYEMDLSYEGAKFEALDIVELKNLQNINKAEDIEDPYFIDPVDGLMCYSYTDDRQFVLVPGLGVIDTITINFDLQNMVHVVVKQCQYSVKTNVKDILGGVDKVEALLPKAADIPGDATATDPAYQNDGGRSGLCVVTPIYGNSVPGPSPVVNDPTKNPANICCPNSDAAQGPGTPNVKYVEYCVGPFKPDLSPVMFNAFIEPSTVTIGPFLPTDTAEITGEVNNALGDAPVYLDDIKITCRTLAVFLQNSLLGVAISDLRLGAHGMGGKDGIGYVHSGFSHISNHFHIANVDVTSDLFTNPGIGSRTSLELEFTINYHVKVYLQTVDLSTHSSGGIGLVGPASGDIIVERHTEIVRLTVNLEDLIDIVEA